MFKLNELPVLLLPPTLGFLPKVNPRLRWSLRCVSSSSRLMVASLEMSASSSIRARMGSVCDVSQKKGIHCRLAHDLQRPSLVVSPSNRRKCKGRSSQTPTSSKPSSDAKAKAQPKKDGAKGKGKGKKDKSSNKPSAKSSHHAFQQVLCEVFY